MAVPQPPEDPTRREFLKHGMAAAASYAAASPAWPAAVRQTRPPAPKATTSTGALSPGPRVIRVASNHVMPVRIPLQPLLKELLELALCDLTDTTSPERAWRAILEPDDVILLKFNRSARSLLQTTPAVAQVITESIVRAGWSPEQLIVVEAGSAFPLAGKTRRPDFRWQGEVVEFGSAGSDVFTATLDQATAIINVPFLKTHHRAVMTSCLKNLSHGLIRHPARFHANGCSPAIGQIAASAPIRRRLRLNIVDALRVVYERGADAREREVHTFGGLLLSADPVACDAVGFSILNEIRSLRRFPPLLPDAEMPAQLATAHALGLGNPDASEIDLRVHDLTD